MIFDGFTFFNELDLLDVRLHELDPIVDQFILVEARQTFQGDEKPLYFAENKDRFQRFLPKIRHIIIDFPEDTGYRQRKYNKMFSQFWNREFYQRDQIAQGLTEAKKDDLIIISDVDEIPSRICLEKALAERRKGDLTIFEMPMFSHFIDRMSHFRQRRDNSLHWLGPRMIEYRYFPGAQKLRSARLFASARKRETALNRVHIRLSNFVKFGIHRPIFLVRNSGWHLNSIGGWPAWREKVDAYSHAEYKELDRYRSPEAFAQFVAQNTDPVDLTRLPDFIQKHPERFVRFCAPCPKIRPMPTV